MSEFFDPNVPDDDGVAAEAVQKRPTADDASGARRRGRLSVSDRIRDQRRSERVVLLVVRALFLVMLASVTTLTIWARADPNEPGDFSPTTVIAIILSTMAVGVIVLAVDYLTPNKRLASTVGVYLGICVGLLGAIAIARLIDTVAQAWGLETNPYIELAKVVVGIVLCYLAVSFVLTTKDDFRLVIPYVEFAKQVRGTRPMLLDTSVLIDGRIEAMVQSGFIDAPLVVPVFVVEELQILSDSGDRLKRSRGRRGLDVVTRLQKEALIELSIDDVEVPGHSVDHKLVELARTQQMRILTTDYNLMKVAKINGAAVLNVNDLASGLKTVVVPGESMHVEIVKRGENEGQGVGYMPDGTMIVVENAKECIGASVDVVVTNSLQTSAGRMIFARVETDSDGNGSSAQEDDSAASRASNAASAATSQPRHTDPTGSARRGRSNPGRSPRR
ncbi:MAG: PIN/TRAM domain-containing protein [Phycisphaerales bacterium]